MGSLRYCLYWLILWDLDGKMNETFGYIKIYYVPLIASVCLKFVVLILIWIGNFLWLSWLEKSIFFIHVFFYQNGLLGVDLVACTLTSTKLLGSCICRNREGCVVHSFENLMVWANSLRRWGCGLFKGLSNCILKVFITMSSNSNGTSSSLNSEMEGTSQK